MTTDPDPDVDEQWHPGQVLEPGRPCPAHLRQQIRDALEAGREAEDQRLALIAQRQEPRK